MATQAATGEQAVDPLAEKKDVLPKLGDEITISDHTKLKLLDTLGEGGYGIVFKSTLPNIGFVAVKTEKYSKSFLDIEADVLKSARDGRCRHFCEMYQFGIVRQDYVFLVMSLLNRDLHRLRGEVKDKDKKFSHNTALRLAIQTFKATEELHRIGFVSRDIKPCNFAPGLKENLRSKTIIMYDFGLARRYTDKNGKHLASRGVTGFRGTNRYASVSAHQRMDLGRKDDLESWFYSCVEMTRGTLPWRYVNDRKPLEEAKRSSRTTMRTQFLFEMPKFYDRLLTMIDELQFESTPEYDNMYGIMEEYRREHKIDINGAWDWEDNMEGSEPSNGTSTLTSQDSHAENVNAAATTGANSKNPNPK